MLFNETWRCKFVLMIYFEENTCNMLGNDIMEICDPGSHPQSVRVRSHLWEKSYNIRLQPVGGKHQYFYCKYGENVFLLRNKEEVVGLFKMFWLMYSHSYIPSNIALHVFITTLCKKFSEMHMFRFFFVKKITSTVKKNPVQGTTIIHQTGTQNLQT